MGETRRARIAATRLGVLVCLFALPWMLVRAQDGSQQSGDPVADAARKAREEKKTAAKPKKIFTEDDLAPRTATKDIQPPANGTTATTPQNVSQPSDGSSTVVTGLNQPKESEEVTWRKRFKEASNKLVAAQKQLDILQRDLNKSELQYYPDPQKAMKEQYSREGIKERTEKIDIQKAEVAKLKQALADLEEDLRKSGGDIGWARE